MVVPYASRVSISISDSDRQLRRRGMNAPSEPSFYPLYVFFRPIKICLWRRKSLSPQPQGRQPDGHKHFSCLFKVMGIMAPHPGAARSASGGQADKPVAGTAPAGG